MCVFTLWPAFRCWDMSKEGEELRTTAMVLLISSSDYTGPFLPSTQSLVWRSCMCLHVPLLLHSIFHFALCFPSSAIKTELAACYVKLGNSSLNSNCKSLK